MKGPFQPHPFSLLFPLRDGKPLTELRDTIKENGQLEPIVLVHRDWPAQTGPKQILSGNRRQAAAIAAGVEPIYRDFGSRETDGDDALYFAYADYFRRDDLSHAEKQEAAVKYANLKRGFSSQKTATPPVGEKKPVSQKEAAKKFGADPKSVQRAKKVLEKGAPELVEAFREELVSVSDAAAIADESPDVQKEAVEMVKTGKTKTLKGAIEALSGPAPEVALLIARDLEAIIPRLERLVTVQPKAHQLAQDSLKNLVALVRKL